MIHDHQPQHIIRPAHRPGIKLSFSRPFRNEISADSHKTEDRIAAPTSANYLFSASSPIRFSEENGTFVVV